MAPRPLPQSWPSPSPNHNTLQWHPAMPPSNGTLQWHHVHSPKVGRHLPPAIAHYNGTQQWHHVHSPKVGRHLPPTIAYNGTLQWHPAMAPRLAQQWHHVQCTLQWHPGPIRQSGSSPSPPIGSKNPYSYRYLGKSVILGELFEVALSQHGTALWRETHLQVKMLRNWRSRSTFWCSNVKLHTVVARSTFASQMFKKTRMFGALFEVTTN